MLARNCTSQDLTGAADEVGVRAVISSEKPLRFVLKTSGPTSDGRPTKYGRRSRRVQDGKRRRVPGAVCWHGHRDFFRALYRRQPAAWIKSSLAVYDGAEDFEAKHQETADKDMGAGWASAYGFSSYGSACDCEENHNAV